MSDPTVVVQPVIVAAPPWPAVEPGRPRPAAPAGGQCRPNCVKRLERARLAAGGIKLHLAIWLATFGLCGVGASALAGEDHWVGTWACGPQLTEPRNLPPVALTNSTLRQFVHTSLGGQRVRVRFSNAYGTNSVSVLAAHVALATGGLGRGTIDPNTDRALAFKGAPGVSILPGEAVFSDPIDFPLPALTNLAVSIYFGNLSTTTLNGHPGSRTTSFIAPGDVVSAANLSSTASTAHWYILTGVDVLADAAARAVVILGDSITDGRGSTTDGNDRWPDDLARRLQANAATSKVGVLNMGIGGNGVFGGLGPAALKRFDRDVIEQSGAHWLMVFEGVNDIGSSSSTLTTAANLLNAYARFAQQAQAHNLRAYGATITPFGGSGYYSDLHESERQIVNAWFRTNSVFDAVIDLDAAVRDPASATKLLPAYDSGDHLHLNPAGYQAMADAVDLKLFK